MSLYKDEAVVLRTMRLGEADRIVTLVGRNNGKIRAVVKGVRRTKSRYGGRLEPFSYVSLVIWKGKSDLHTITQAEVLDPFRAVKEDLDRLNLGAVMLEACDRVAQESEDSARVLSLLVQSLRRLSADGSPMVLAGFLLQLCGIAGFAPSMDRCAECSRPASWFSPGQGGAVCPGCRTFDSEEVGTSVLELMSDLAVPLSATPRLPGRPPSAEDMATASRLARFYTEYHLERRLKSASAAEAMARF
ncbi:MAG TPA: DNA repair protein RecO [Actinomycetota bacterium]|nr:DNA repair protein RecO [Actinomycetota bacterium]